MHEIYVLDRNGNPANAVPQDLGNGVIVAQPVSGALAGWKGLSYTPSAAAIDSVPQDTVTVPLSDWRNVAVGGGAQLMVWDSDLGDEVARGPILDVEDTVDENDVHWATVTFADVLYDLTRADVTSSFATATNETLSLSGTRLLSLADTTWSLINDVTGLDGIAFVATGSVAQAFDKLRQERFAHFRRERANGDPRILHFSTFGTPLMYSGLPVWMVEPGPDVTKAAGNPNRRQMFAPQFSRKAEIVNSITPVGAGNGATQLTLRVLYGNTSFAGYDPAHPILQRPCQSGATSDGFDYYIEDAASIALYGRTRGPCSQPSIAPVVNSTGGVSTVDMVAGAVALYTVGLNVLKRGATPYVSLTFTSPGIGDVRNTGGMTVHVKYDGWAFDTLRNAYQFLAIDADYWVTSVVRAEQDDGTNLDTWTVTTNGQAAQSAEGTLLGVMDTVTQLHTAVQPYPMAKPRPKSQNIGPGADLNVEIFADNSMVQRHWAIVYLTLEGMVHTRADNGHTTDVTTAPMNHDVNALPHDVGFNATGNYKFSVGGSAVSSASVAYDPAVRINVQGAAPPAGAAQVFFDGQFFYAQGKAAFAVTSGAVLNIEGAVPSTGGKGGNVVKTTGAADIAAGNPTPGTVGGSVPKATHLASAGVGGKLTVATTESVYRGPVPTGVTVWVDNVQRFGPFNTSPPPLDITPFVNNSAAHTVTVKSATNGAADVFIDIRDDVTTFATRPTG